MVVHDPPNNVVSGFDGVVIGDHSCALVEGRSEKSTGEFLLASFTDVVGGLSPRVGDEKNVLQSRFTTEFAVCDETPSGDPTEQIVGDVVDEDDPGECGPFPISVEKLSPQDRGAINADACSTHVVAMNDATMFKTSVSLLVSSNPGVSMRITALPSRVNSSATWISVVHESKPVPICRREPLARLIN